jgi:LacI family transcriptional regulator
MNLETIARLAGVSRSTVSRVANDDPRVSPEVRERVQLVIRDNNYHPNAAARSLASRRTGILGLLIPGAVGAIFSDPYFPTLIQAVADACNAADRNLMLMIDSSDSAIAIDRLYRRVIRGRHLDGIIVSASLVDDPMVRQLEHDRFPVVVIGRQPAFPTIARVDVDNIGAARSAVAHLIDHGYRRVATITGPDNLFAARERLEGYAAALAAAGLPYDPTLVAQGDFSQASGTDAMRRLLALPEGPPQAVFAASDAMAIGALGVLSDAGMKVPEDVALMGFDGLERHAQVFPGLSTVVQPVAEFGREAVTILLHRISEPDNPPLQRILPTRMIIRQSCGCAPAASG